MWLLPLQDLLVKNVKRHLRQARKDGSDLQALDFLPTTYILPQVDLSCTKLHLIGLYVAEMVISGLSHVGQAK